MGALAPSRRGERSSVVEDREQEELVRYADWGSCERGLLGGGVQDNGGGEGASTDTGNGG